MLEINRVYKKSKRDDKIEGKENIKWHKKKG